MTGIIVLHYCNPDFFWQCFNCLRFLDDCEIHVIENNSARTLKAEMPELIAAGQIKKYALFEENIANMATTIYCREGHVDWTQYDYVVTTDADLVPDEGWLDECKAILAAHPEVFVCSVGLYMDNLPVKTMPHAKDWIPPRIDRGDYYETITGTHFMTFRARDFIKYLKHLRRENLAMLDERLHELSRAEKMKCACTKQARAYHLTWDLYQDLNHPYTREKIHNPLIWHQNRRCGYEVMQ